MNIISEKAQIGEGTKIGNFTSVFEDVKIGKSCIIGNNVVIHKGTKIGDFVRIDDNTVIGKGKMRAVLSVVKDVHKEPPAEIGDNCLIGTHVVIYAGAKISKHVLVADSASIRERVSIGEYTIVGRLVTIEQDVEIGRKCKLETGCYITAISKIEDYCFIAPMVTTSNDNYMGRTEERLKHFKGVTVKKGGRIGANAVILPGIKIAEDGQAAAGAVVTKDIPPKKIYVGVPAKPFRDVPNEQLLESQNWD
ncbi:DapH/DapD/GlmU-related protein [candidate division KSB1 bacterium]